ncbi:uncharacterized protein LOC131159474 isoform X2 [Malania oleifera]|uniref:uncharacterized protein LOC131159474 isoform X2 n=1 Tax=Malania oleifera TaxID=397392 RepID=UPI0025AE4688|nr:uncharacterized protein LOC131159474 isoform X2 [Malania oleifera]
MWLSTMEEKISKTGRQLEIAIVHKVGDVVSAINDAKNVDEVICALHSLAVMLFPLDSSLLSGSIDERYRDRLVSTKVLSAQDRSDWWGVFYRGVAFPTLARVLLYDIASSWLACFPFSARKHVYDVFFVSGLSTEVVQAVVPCLQQGGSDSLDSDAVRSNAERLLVICLLENNGVLHMAREFSFSCQSEDLAGERLKTAISRVAQLVASIPDKAQPRAPTSLSSHLFFKQITVQLLAEAEERDTGLNDKAFILDKSNMTATLLFLGETFARICRRGSADVLLGEVLPQILGHVRVFLRSNISNVVDAIESKPGSKFWLRLMEAIKDPYAVERLSEHIFHQLAAEGASDEEAYWVLWILFHRIFHQTSVRSLFIDKFLLWKVFPICCLRWLLQFAVLERPPNAGTLKGGQNSHNLINVLQCLVTVWSKREFVQSASMEQQAYVTAAVGLSLEKMSKEELDATKEVMHSILQGVSCRLESPNDLVRRMASGVALVFSKVVDPKNLLYLDDSCSQGTVDWEFGLTTPGKKIPPASHRAGKSLDKIGTSTTSEPRKELNCRADIVKHEKGKKNKFNEFKLINPDEIIDPATITNESFSDDDINDDNSSENSESSSDSSLQPYDLSDDDTDLKRKFSQLVDIVGALRKSDDADAVERALDVAEKLVRASPDELFHVSADLARTLVQVRCSDSTIEGEEESAEEKRQKALVALLVTCPLESLNTLNKLLYSPTVDTSQRILILDVMTDAALELAAAKTMQLKQPQNPLISTTSETPSWFLPSSIGPPGAGSWKQISETGTGLNYSYCYERELPSKPGQIKRGKTRRWSVRSTNLSESQIEWLQNKFPVHAAAFMLPAMQGFDKKRHGVDLLGRDFIVLGKLVHMLGVCMKCAAMHPEASALAPPLLDMLSSSEICQHKEAYVRRSVLFAASCILVALHPSYLASALIEGNPEISRGLEWVRTWALHVVESDTDRECYTMAMKCLQLHAEMALQASRALESAAEMKAQGVGLPNNLSKGTIKIPYSRVEYK